MSQNPESHLVHIEEVFNVLLDCFLFRAVLFMSGDIRLVCGFLKNRLRRVYPVYHKVGDVAWEAGVRETIRFV